MSEGPGGTPSEGTTDDAELAGAFFGIWLDARTREDRLKRARRLAKLTGARRFLVIEGDVDPKVRVYDAVADTESAPMALKRATQPSVLAALDTAMLSVVSANASAFTSAQLGALTTAQLSAITGNNTGSLGGGQIGGAGTGYIGSLSTAEIAALTACESFAAARSATSTTYFRSSCSASGSRLVAPAAARIASSSFTAPRTPRA